ncbi:hypothetical protein HAX54_014824 [Datura stramonium]|uniref:Uncharacterized protein n=1 Tax=Datura stramonium TaxID=4076 RepID=A0ABS8TNN6_DATST|nr:hypothetical protein [Datura stramonium]
MKTQSLSSQIVHIGSVVNLGFIKEFQGESTGSHEHHCWRKVRLRSDKLGDAYLAVLEIPDNVDSPLRTLTILSKEVKQKKGNFYSSRWSKMWLSSNLKKHPTAAVSVFDGKKVVLNYQNLFISELWSRFGIEKVSSIRQSLSEVKEKIEKLRRKEKDLDVLLEATKKEVEEAK